jgi:hypothetical protein
VTASPAIPKYVSEHEASAITGFAVGTLRNWRSRGEGPPIIQKKRTIRYRVSDLIEFMEAGRVEPRQ